MTEEYELKKARNYISTLFSKRSYTRKEISDKLKRKKYEAEVIEAIVREFEALGYLNDGRYARAYAADSKNFRSAGKKLVQMKLLQKGVDKGIIANALEYAYKDTDEFKMAYKLAERRYKNYKKKDKVKEAKRMQGFLVRRGYNFDTALKVIKKLMKDVYYEE
ncbi:MAG: regulatory protein RecX [Candidatus Firestonebacteria bacterium]